MKTDKLSVRPVSRTMQKERDRERCRMRDRQRRESMSQEQREQHLARRRKSYQLRRQKLGKSQLNSQREQASIATTGELSTWNQNQAIVIVPDHSIQYERIGNAEFTEGRPSEIKCSGEFLFLQGKQGAEPRVCRSTEFPRRLHLYQIRHLARLLNTPRGREKIGAADLKAKQSATGNCRSRKILRLVHVKRLARALNSAMVKAPEQSHLSETQVEENMDYREIQLTGNDASGYVQSNTCKGRIR